MGNLITNIYEAMRTDTEQGETCGELYEAVREQYGISLRGFQMRFAKETGNGFAKNREVTAKEKSEIAKAYPPKGKMKRPSQGLNKAGERPAVKASPGYLSRLTKWTNEADLATPVFRGMYAAGILAHAALVWQECGYLWGDAGYIAGAVVGVVIAGSVVIMATPKHHAVTDNLLWFVWFLDGCAWFVHKAALYHQGTNAWGAGITETGTGCLAAVICLCAGALAYFYRETGKK